MVIVIILKTVVPVTDVACVSLLHKCRYLLSYLQFA